MNVRINGVNYQGPHAGGLVCAILLINFGIIFTIMSIALIVVGAQFSSLWPMWVAGIATLLVFAAMLTTGIIAMKVYMKRIQQEMNNGISDVPVVSGYHPQAVALPSLPPPYPGHESDTKLGHEALSRDPPPYPGHQQVYP